MATTTIPVYNIILLGKSGVGKSTLINAIANYFVYETLEEALEINEPQGVIPVTYEITLKNFKKIKITQLGINRADAGNENYERQSSSRTQEPRVYSFYNETVGFNVIDIPGIGDTRGATQDAANRRIILDKLRQFSVIHGIFIMFKAFEPKLTPEMRYNLNETLMMLHTEAVPNIMFVITTSRVADYHPGETMNTLEDYAADLERVQGIRIQLNPDTVFCVDNEAYKFQCGWNKSEEYRAEFKDEIKNYSKSWKVSKDAIFKLFQKLYNIEGHRVELSCAIGQARTIIHCVIGPLASMTTLIQQALSPTNRKANIESLMKSGNEIKNEIEIEGTSTSQLVCTSKKCIELIPIPGTKNFNFNFKTVCHKNCLLKNVMLLKFPEPALADCQVFNSGGICKHCGCSVNRHMLIRHKQILQQKVKKVASKPLTKEEAELFMDIFIQAQLNEQTTIVAAIVKLSCYLKQNAILEYNNAFEERINLEIEIRKEQAAVDAGSHDSREVIKKLETTLALYKNEMKAIDVAIQNGNTQVVTEEDIKTVLSSLFALQNNGANIKRLYEAESSECQQSPEVKTINPREILHYKAKYLPQA